MRMPVCTWWWSQSGVGFQWPMLANSYTNLILIQCLTAYCLRSSSAVIMYVCIMIYDVECVMIL